MVLTRFHHFGDVLHLPDASLAVFFFAGFYRNKMLLGFLMALAAVIDYVAIANGTSGWCVTPAYAFLIPTYAVMWLAGRFCAASAATHATERAFWVKAVGLLSLATAIAFVISNGSFYLFSDRYANLSWLQYLDRVAQYFPFYFGATLIYGLIGLALSRLFKARISMQDKRNIAS
jgi:cation transport ATPase